MKQSEDLQETKNQAQVIREVLAHLVKIPALWDAEQVANYLGVAPRTVAEKFVHRRDFPAALMITPSTKRWNPQEIIEWAQTTRIKKRKLPSVAEKPTHQ